MSQTIDQVYRDFKTMGVPTSGDHWPDKAEIRALLKMIQNSGGEAIETERLRALSAEQVLRDSIAGVSQGYESYAEISDLPTSGNDNGDLAYVYNNNANSGDPLNGFYQWGGSSWDAAVWMFNQVGAALGARLGAADSHFLFWGGGLGGQSGQQNLGVGRESLYDLTTGLNNAAFGHAAGARATSATYSTWIGWGSGSEIRQAAGVYNSTAIGSNSYTTMDQQVALGDDNVLELRMFGRPAMRKIGFENWFLAGAGNYNLIAPTAGGALGIGSDAMANWIGGDAGPSIAIGYHTMNEATGGSNLVAVGRHSMLKTTGLIDCVAVGSMTLRNALTGVGDTAIGHRALEHATAARNNTALGDSALWTSQGFGNVAAGYVAAEYLATGDHNVFMGLGAARNRGSGNRNTIVGYSANQFPAVVPDPITGAGAQAAGDDNAGFGHQVLLSTTGARNAVFGSNAGRSLTTGGDNVLLGYNAGFHGSQKVDAANSIAIGSGTFTTADNQVVIGNGDVEELVFAGVSFTKDQMLALKAMVA